MPAEIPNYINAFIGFANDMSNTEVWILVVITALLILILAYRLFGIGVVMVLGVVYLIMYVLYINDFLHLYDKRQADENRQKTILEEELKK
jgi:hypothetical protein